MLKNLLISLVTPIHIAMRLIRSYIKVDMNGTYQSSGGK